MVNLLHLSQDEAVRLITLFVGVSAACSVTSYLWGKLCNVLQRALDAISNLSLFRQDLPGSKDPKSNGVGKTKDEDPKKEALKKGLKENDKLDKKHIPSIEPILTNIKQPIINNNPLLQPISMIQQLHNLLVNSALWPQTQLAAEILTPYFDANWRNISGNILELGRLQNSSKLTLKDQSQINSIALIASNYFYQNCRPEKVVDSKTLQPNKAKIIEKAHKIVESIYSAAKLKSMNADADPTNKTSPKEDKEYKEVNRPDAEARYAAEAIKELIAEYRASDQRLEFSAENLLSHLHLDPDLENNLALTQYVEAVQHEIQTGAYGGTFEQPIESISRSEYKFLAVN